jgi:hypothetical protein
MMVEDMQQGDGAGVEGDGQEQATLLARFGVTDAETLHALDDFGVHISAEARFAEGLGTDCDGWVNGLTAPTEGQIDGLCGRASSRHDGFFSMLCFTSPPLRMNEMYASRGVSIVTG